MKTVQITIDEDLLRQVDEATGRLHTSRSAFIRSSLQQALERMRVTEWERQHREGYARLPVEPSEFDLWESEHAWGEE
jgi:metal-responsive CopG/Arc/MetJ family transcriptional regulator